MVTIHLRPVMLRKVYPLISALAPIILITFLLVTSVSAASSQTSWSKTYGGPEGDKAYAMIETREGGYALAGTTNSFGSGLINAWLVKTDVVGNRGVEQVYILGHQRDSLSQLTQRQLAQI